MTADRKDSIFAQYESESPIATELRRLYSNIKSGNQGRSYKSFLLTSSTRGEGKTTISSYLALTIAQFPRTKVLIVDADLRRPRLHSIFGVEDSTGFADCLGQGEDPLSVAQKTPLPNLDVITAGVHRESPSKLFESDMLSEFFAKVSFYYDIVLVDSAPALAVADTLFLSTRAEAVLFVVLAGVTPSELVVRAKEALVDARANLAGVVVNNMSQVLPFYYDYKYYGAYKDA
jgi:capsular exopolysaccharide synthesis family protein